MLGRQRGQSTLEYIVVLTAIVAAVVLAAVTIGKTGGTTGLSKIFQQSANKIETESNKIGQLVN